MLVGPTSVTNFGGLGLYSLEEFNVGDVMPFRYKGIHLNEDKYDELNKFLSDIENYKEDDKGNKIPKTAEEIRADLKKSYNTWKLRIIKGPSKRSEPNWDKIYQSFLDYLFEYIAFGKSNFIFWGTYDYDGNLVIDPNDPSNAGLFMNEPPPYKQYLNILTGKYQLASPNVEQLSDNEGIFFRAIKKISIGDEVLLCYGPFYDRNYDINLGREGCGADLFREKYNDYNDYDEKIKKYFEQSDSYVNIREKYERPDKQSLQLKEWATKSRKKVPGFKRVKIPLYKNPQEVPSFTSAPSPSPSQSPSLSPSLSPSPIKRVKVPMYKKQKRNFESMFEEEENNSTSEDDKHHIHMKKRKIKEKRKNLCSKCGEKGHNRVRCPNKNEDENDDEIACNQLLSSQRCRTHKERCVWSGTKCNDRQEGDIHFSKVDFVMKGLLPDISDHINEIVKHYKLKGKSKSGGIIIPHKFGISVKITDSGTITIWGARDTTPEKIQEVLNEVRDTFAKYFKIKLKHISNEDISESVSVVHARGKLQPQSIDNMHRVLLSMSDVSNVKKSDKKVSFKRKNQTITIWSSGSIWIVARSYSDIRDAYGFVVKLTSTSTSTK